MKKAIVFVSALFLFASGAFAQTPQNQDKTKPAAKSECPMKNDGKCSMDKKETKACSEMDKSGSSTSTAKPSGSTQAIPAKQTEQKPEKK